MPGKARRVASRQAQLGRRKKRQQGATANVEALAITPTTEGDGEQRIADLLPSALEAPEAPPVPVPAPVRQPRPSPVAARNAAATAAPARSSSRARRERPATYNFIGTEVRRILSLSGVVLVTIVVLGIVL